MLLKTSGKAKHRDLAQDAALHGVKLKNNIEPLEITDEERKDHDKQAQSAFERLQQKYKMKSGNNGN